MDFGTIVLAASFIQLAAYGSDAEAARSLAEARQHRYSWGTSFAGFSTDIAIRQNDLAAKGSLRVDKDGKATVALEGGTPELRAEAEQALRSVVQHHASRSSRHGEGKEQPEVRFLDNSDHPAGRLLEVAGDRHSSTYRVKDGILRVVNRNMGDRKTTITVLDTMPVDSNKHLVTLYSVSNWSPDGALTTSSTVRSQWNKVDHLYLPAAIEEVETGKESWKVTTYAFSNYKLGE